MVGGRGFGGLGFSVSGLMVKVWGVGASGFGYRVPGHLCVYG